MRMPAQTYCHVRVCPPQLAYELLKAGPRSPAHNPVLLTPSAFNRYWRMNEYVKFSCESWRCERWNGKPKVLAAVIKRPHHIPQGRFMIFNCLNVNFDSECISHIPEITPIILKTSRPLKFIFLVSVLCDIKIICIFIHRKMCPSVI